MLSSSRYSYVLNVLLAVTFAATTNVEPSLAKGHEDYVRRQAEIATASPAGNALQCFDTTRTSIAALTQIVINSATVFPPFTETTSPKSIPTVALNDTPLVFEALQTSSRHSPSVDDFQPVLFAPLPRSTTLPSSSGTPSAWTLPLAMPPQSLLLPHSPEPSLVQSTSPTLSLPSQSRPSLQAPQASHTLVKGPIMAGYYPDWAEKQMSPESVDFTRLDWVDFAFAFPDSSGNLKFSQDDSEQLLDRLVKSAHAKGKHVKLSIGGWSDSGSFSPIVASPSTRALFISNIVEAYHLHNLDGIDLDWEYPGEPGLPGNQISPEDTSNFLLFFKGLRATLPPEAVISAACQDWPFAGPDGRPIADASPFAEVLDWIVVMNYDVWGSSTTPGPNAPLADGCGNSSQPMANAGNGIESWMNANFPTNKILLGIPSYGYTSKSRATQLIARSIVPLVVTNDDDNTTNNGQVQFTSLVHQGALEKNSDGTYIGGGGFVRSWDSCSSTPWLRSDLAGQIVTYDDPASIQIKATFAKEVGLLGLNLFDVHGDTHEWELIDAARRGMGILN